MESNNNRLCIRSQSYSINLWIDIYRCYSNLDEWDVSASSSLRVVQISRNVLRSGVSVVVISTSDKCVTCVQKKINSQSSYNVGSLTYRLGERRRPKQLVLGQRGKVCPKLPWKRRSSTLQLGSLVRLTLFLAGQQRLLPRKRRKTKFLGWTFW